MTNNHPDQIDDLLNEFRRQTIVIDGGSVLGPKEDARAFDQSLAQAHAAVKMLMLKTQVQMLKELYILPNVYPEKINGEYTHVHAIYKSALADRIKNLEGEIEGMNHG